MMVTGDQGPGGCAPGLSDLAALRGLEILESAPERRFDSLVRVAKMALDVPLAMVTLVDEDGDRMRPRSQIDLTDGGRLAALCGFALVDDAPVVVPDTSVDERFADNPLMSGMPDVRFYAAIPIRVRGIPVGTLCLADARPRELTATQRRVLDDLGVLVETEVSYRHDGLLDHLTGLLNRRGLERAGSVLLQQAVRDGREVAVVFGDLDGLKAVNDRSGHAAGDRALRECADLLADSFRSSDVIARVSGDEFAVLLLSQGLTFAPDDLQHAVDRFRDRMQARNAAAPDSAPLGMSLGAASRPATEALVLADLLREADALMYAEKGRQAR